MKAFIIYLLPLIFSSSLSHTNEIKGTWKIPDEKVVIEIKENGSFLHGIIVKADNPKAIGKEILKDLRQEGGKWTGTFYAIRKDKLLDATLTLKGAAQLEVELTYGFFNKTMVWDKVD